MIKRRVEKIIKDSLQYKEITVIVGARQVGKTTIIKKIIKDLQSQGNTTLYFNLDIETDKYYFSSQELLLEKIKLETGFNNKAYIFIDEIQQKKNAGLFLKGIYDMDLPYKFIVTGSGSLELKEQISESLTGRKHLIEMYPVYFDEFIDYKTSYRYTERLQDFFKIETQKLNLLLKEYLLYGGYPAVIIATTALRKLEIMNEIFSSYLIKDISFLLNVRQPDKFTKLIKLLTTMSGNIINYSYLAQNTGLKTSTLKTYLWYTEQTYVISLIKPFYNNKKKEITKSPTVYFNDTGMLNFLKNNLNEQFNDGFVFQNFIYTVLKEKYETPLFKLQYWRTKNKAKVDFILHNEQEIIPVEVKDSPQKKAQITRSLYSFIKHYNPTKAYIINKEQDLQITVNNTKVIFMPYWKLFV